MNNPLRAVITATAFSVSALISQAEIIYDNSESNQPTYYPSTNEYGDQITVKEGEWTLTNFEIGYFGNIATKQGDERGRLRFYYNDGTEGSSTNFPKTLFYDSGFFSLNSSWQTVEAKGLSIPLLHNTFTWTIEFTGLSGQAGDRAGLISYDPPSVGSSDNNSFWEKRDGQWKLVKLPESPSNFGARAEAIARPATVQARIESISRANNQATLQARGTAGKLYSLEYKNDLEDTGWIRQGQTRATATGESFTLVDATATVPHRFYRIAESDSGISVENGVATVVSRAVPGLRYALEARNNFGNGAWDRVGAEKTALGQTVTFADTAAATQPTRFYRVVQL
ncbi:MAG: hypothetical protein ACO1QB_01730 [Verrucomicrobiales bacterium]